MSWSPRYVSLRGVNNHIVQPKPVAKPAEAQPAAQPQPAAQAQSQPAAQAQPQPAAQAQPQPVAQAQPAQQPSTAALTPEMEVAVNDLVMLTGKTKEQCTLALRAAQGVPDVAYEILASGMPLTGNEADMMGDDYGDEDEDPSIGGGAGGMPAGANPFAALAQNPNFALIR